MIHSIIRNIKIEYFNMEINFGDTNRYNLYFGIGSLTNLLLVST